MERNYNSPESPTDIKSAPAGVAAQPAGNPLVQRTGHPEAEFNRRDFKLASDAGCGIKTRRQAENWPTGAKNR